MEDSDKDFDKYIASVDSLLKAQSAIINQLCEEHPTLSTRFNTFRKGNTLWQQARDFGQSRFRGPNFQLPDNARRYAYDNFWTKMEKPYTLHRGLSGFLRDYLDDAADARNAVFSYNIRDHYKDFASNDEELALLTRWKKWIDESTAIIEAEPTAEAKERKSHELDSLNADQIKEVDKIVQSPRASKIIHGGLLVNTLKQHQLTLDSLRADPFIKDVWLTRQALSHIDHDRTSLLPNIVDTLKAMITGAKIIGQPCRPQRGRGTAEETPRTIQGQVRAARHLGNVVQPLQGSPLALHRGVRPPEGLRHPVSLSGQQQPAGILGERHQGVQRQRPQRCPLQPARRAAICHRASPWCQFLPHLQTLQP